MTRKINPPFCPSIDGGSGRTRELLHELVQSYEAGSNEGATEILSVLKLLCDDQQHPFINYVVTEKSPINKFITAFSRFIAASAPKDRQRELFATGVASATGGLIACLLAHEVAGGEVITTSFNYPGVPNAIVMAGATPRFVDINADDWCMDLAGLDAAITPATRAIVLTHLNRVVDVKPIEDLLSARKLDIPLIQDASVCMGSTLGGMRAGAVNVGKGGATVYSFTISKVLSGLGGGVVLSHDLEFVQRVNTIAYQGMSMADPGALEAIGGNFKMNDLHAAIVLAQLNRCEELFEQRRVVRSWYERELAKDIDDGILSMQHIDDDTLVTHFGVLIPKRDEIVRTLAYQHQIICGWWFALHQQLPYRERFGYDRALLPVSENIAPRHIFLPFYSAMSEEEVKRTCDRLRDVVRNT